MEDNQTFVSFFSLMNKTVKPGCRCRCRWMCGMPGNGNGHFAVYIYLLKWLTMLTCQMDSLTFRVQVAMQLSHQETRTRPHDPRLRSPTSDKCREIWRRWHRWEEIPHDVQRQLWWGCHCAGRHFSVF